MPQLNQNKKAAYAHLTRASAFVLGGRGSIFLVSKSNQSVLNRDIVPALIIVSFAQIVMCYSRQI